MIAVWSRGAAVMCLWLCGSLLLAEYTFKAQVHDDMEARLTAAAAQRTAKQGFAELTLSLTIEGPASLEVEPPRLGDAAAVWKDERSPIQRKLEGGRTSWHQAIRLKQVKPGIEPVADLTVRFRRGQEDDWAEAKWTNIFREIRELREPPPPEPNGQPSWLWRGGMMILVLALAALVLTAWWSKRRARRELPLPPEQWALREIDRLEFTMLPPKGEVESYHTQMSYVVRRYCSERFGGHALQQTTAEFLDELQRTSGMPAEQQMLLREWFQRCDLAKFARAGASSEECRRTAKLARELIRQTSSADR
jgi:hypothetical protein